jgi:endogenous inhibitor of DNA gyrase (YacG/DUF329 family)
VFLKQQAASHRSRALPADNKTPRPTRVVTCPTCKGESLYAPSNPYRPFCSERCKNMDFGAWAGEGFRLPADGEPDQSVPGADRMQ